MPEQQRFHDVEGCHLDGGEESENNQRLGPVPEHRNAESKDEQGGQPNPEVGYKAQEGAQEAPEQGVGNTDQSQADPKCGAKHRVDQ